MDPMMFRSALGSDAYSDEAMVFFGARLSAAGPHPLGRSRSGGK